MTVQHTYQEFYRQLQQLYDQREAANITDWVIEHVTGLRNIDRVIQKTREVSDSDSEKLKRYLGELLLHRPVQYVLNESWFSGLKFFVNDSVLIPRPETEELVEWMVDVLKKSPGIKILDIGTGSGCIAVSLKKKMPYQEVSAMDISREALEVAKINAKRYSCSISFFQADILREDSWGELPVFDCLVSNPPYIPGEERMSVPDNVLKFEPHLALFVEEDPLVFYRQIIHFSIEHLRPGGWIFFETHEQKAGEVASLFIQSDWMEVEVRKDLQGKQRMVAARKKNEAFGSSLK